MAIHLNAKASRNLKPDSNPNPKHSLKKCEKQLRNVTVSAKVCHIA